jgi:DNA-binding XRE family transcriptional regulator
MPDLDLRSIREHLGLTQSAFATLVGFSVRAIQSCEQGWRHPSPALEKMAILLYIARQQGKKLGELACWDLMNCSPAHRDECVAYTTRQGHLCWFLTGNLSCAQQPLENWEEKKQICFRCGFFRNLLRAPSPEAREEAIPAEVEPEAVGAWG